MNVKKLVDCEDCGTCKFRNTKPGEKDECKTCDFYSNWKLDYKAVIPKWLKDHKKEVLLYGGILLTGVMLGQLKRDGKTGLTLGLRMAVGEKYDNDDDYYYHRLSKSQNSNTINFNMNNTNLTVKDLGEVGKELMRLNGTIKKNTPVNKLGVNATNVFKN